MPMKTSSNSWIGVGNTFKVFSKLYNAFYCSRRKAPDSAHEEGRAEPLGSQVTPAQEWFDAVKAQDTTRVKQLLQSGADVNTAEEKWTALHLCAWNGFTEMCSTLLQSSYCNVNINGPGESTPLSLAAQRGFIDIAAMLLDQGADVHAIASLTGCENITALHFACQHGHVDIVRLLVNAGASTNAEMVVRGINGVTPLHLAVEAGHMEVMDMLIEAGCDINSSTKSAAPCSSPAANTDPAAAAATKDAEEDGNTRFRHTGSVDSARSPNSNRSAETANSSDNIKLAKGTVESYC